MTAGGLVLLALAGVYAWRLVSFARGFRAVARQSDGRVPLTNAALPTVTVVVPARDEADSIGACVDAILGQDYPPEKLEVIVVDDDSSDATPDLVRARMPRAVGVAAGAARDDIEAVPTLRLVQIPENRRRARAHKKAAIEKAVAHATGEIILTTDADCLVPPTWARTMAAAFDAPDVAFVSGPVRYRIGPGAGLFARLQAMDFFGLMACGAGGIGLGRPNLANGACVAYRRDVFERLGGFSGIDHVTSGDDELLMQKIAYGPSGLDVRFCAAPEAVVLTEPVESLRAFVHQRKRWASKGANYPPQLQRMLVGLVAFFFALTAAYLALPFAPALWPYVLGALGIKAVADLSVLVPAARRFGQLRLLAVFPIHLVIHAPHSLLVGILGPMGRFEWKGRSLDR